jgi:nucleoside 2-deoxyribosyltransferase
MDIYLAAAYARRAELLGYRRQLEAIGHRVTSQWVLGLHEAQEGDWSQWARFAEDDLYDIDRADLLVAFTEPSDTGPTRGGRHVECGYALGRGIPLVIVGHRENVFYHLPYIIFYPTWAEALLAIKENRIGTA